MFLSGRAKAEETLWHGGGITINRPETLMQSKVPSVQQPSAIADPAAEGHLCLDCRVAISHRSIKALRCEPCSTIRNRQRANRYYQNNRNKVLQRVKKRQQTPNAKRLRQEWEETNPEKFPVYRRRKKQKHREKTGYNPEGRTCVDCGADISDRGHNAKRCKPCSMPAVRTCILCGADIQKRGPSKFCSEQCKVQDRLTNDLAGSTKVCIKCEKTKEHSAFRLHYGRRDSSCKSCEARATRNYYQTLPVEERQQRRRAQWERERIIKANLPSGEKAILRAKARQAHRRKLYGSDFDENDLYSEQGGKCALCDIPKSLEELELDHDHKTKKLRGFLCKNCNLKLLPRYEKFPHQYQDSPWLSEYLQKGTR